MKRLFGLTLLALALAVLPAQAQIIKITTGNNNKPALGPWYLYWPMEAHFQTPASPQYPYWPAPMGLPQQQLGGQAMGGYAPYGASGYNPYPYMPPASAGYNPYQTAPAMPANTNPGNPAPTYRTSY